MGATASRKPDGTEERSRLIKLIHVGRRELGMDDDTWRAYLQQAFMVSSSTQCSVPRLKTALAHLVSRGFQIKNARPPHEWTWVDQAPEERAFLLRKIIKLMQQTDVTLGNQMDYVEGIAKQMGGLNAQDVPVKIHKPLSMCCPYELMMIIKALAIHIKRPKNQKGASHVQPTADA